MQNNKLKLIFILILTAFIFSCSKEVKKPDEEKSVAESKPVENKIEEQKSEPPTPEKTAEQLEAEEKYKKSKAYEEKLKQLESELDKKEDILRYKCPVFMSIDNLAQQKAPALYSHADNFDFIHFYEVKKDGEFCYCKYKAPTQNGGILDYQVTYKWDNLEQIYLPLSYDLLSENNIGKVNEEFIENQAHGSLYSMENDEKKHEMIKLFEDYENTRYPLYLEVANTDWKTGVKTKGYKQYDMRILDYVKGNFTNSGYDEYFVMFYRDHPNPEIDDQFIERVRCFLVSEGKIINDCYISHSGGFFYPGLSDDKLSEVKDFGFKFSQGWIADLNQNGINEIYLAALFNIEGGEVLMIEFSDKSFVTGYVYDARYDIENAIVFIDWYKKMITAESSEWIDDYQWSDTLKEFILLKRKYRED
ncbi:clustered-type lipoprotein [Treponema sp. OMZ 787]|uniref:clustered-type lipoprotein n=1 Tax=Treponema sp. OMZ 787 TaxID=2563669 RepID=UPI0020A30E9A|nr:clustered-type lipoprotein [Treponema sp. OMZ 787]UTC62464.1 clustered-type lipoprotein [Treponema sp. OMZ 787]